MDFRNFKKTAADYFTPAELIELFDISTEDLIAMLDDNGFFDEDVQSDIEEIMGIDEDDD